MTRHRALWLTIVALIFSSLACNAFAGNQRPILGPPPTSIAENTVVVHKKTANDQRVATSRPAIRLCHRIRLLLALQSDL